MRERNELLGRIEGDYLIINTGEEAVASKIDLNLWLYCWQGEKGFKFPVYATRPQVLEAITPKEGDAVFYWNDGIGETIFPYCGELWEGNGLEYEDTAKANALTIGKTVGELRELLAWAGGRS